MPESNQTPPPLSELTARAADWITRYHDQVPNFPIAPKTTPGDVLRMLPDSIPETPEDWDEIFADLDRIVVPNTLHWQHPAFFGYFPANTSDPAMVADLITTGLGVQGMLWQTAPALNELERRVLDQLASAIGLPESFLSTTDAGGGVIQPTASDATLAALLAARSRIYNKHPQARHEQLRVYTSDQAHSSIMKAAMIAGIARHAEDHAQVRIIETDSNGSIKTDVLRAKIQADLQAGCFPTFICATLGTTATGAFDHIPSVHQARSGTDAWLHIDAAWAGAAFICSEFRDGLEGIEHPESFCFNPHKWMLTTFDCSLFWTRDRKPLIEALSITPSYLRSEASESGAVFDYRDWGVPLGRRGRALKLWFVLRHYGMENIREHIRRHVSLAVDLESRVQADQRFALSAPRSLSLVCLHAVADQQPNNELTAKIATQLNKRGRTYITPTTIEREGQPPLTTIRVAVGGVKTQAEHIDLLWTELAEVHAALTQP